MATSGCVIAATNSTTTDGVVLDYVRLAEIAAMLVEKHLKLPTTLITADTGVESTVFEKVIAVPKRNASSRSMIAGQSHIHYQWNNDYRIDAFDYSPYDKTLMIDADFVVQTNRYLNWMDALSADSPFFINHRASSIESQSYPRYLPDGTIRQVWATVMAWTAEAKPVFDMAKMVRENYEFYATLVGMPPNVFRNDLVFSIACHLLDVPFLSNGMLKNMKPDSSIYEASDKSSRASLVVMNNGGMLYRVHYDFHILNKEYAWSKLWQDEVLRANELI